MQTQIFKSQMTLL